MCCRWILRDLSRECAQNNTFSGFWFHIHSILQWLTVEEVEKWRITLHTSMTSCTENFRWLCTLFSCHQRQLNQLNTLHHLLLQYFQMSIVPNVFTCYKHVSTAGCIHHHTEIVVVVEPMMGAVFCYCDRPLVCIWVDTLGSTDGCGGGMADMMVAFAWRMGSVGAVCVYHFTWRRVSPGGFPQKSLPRNKESKERRGETNVYMLERYVCAQSVQDNSAVVISLVLTAPPWSSHDSHLFHNYVPDHKKWYCKFLWSSFGVAGILGERRLSSEWELWFLRFSSELQYSNSPSCSTNALSKLKCSGRAKHWPSWKHA